MPFLREIGCSAYTETKGNRLWLTLLDGGNVRLNWNIESDMNVNWIKFKNFLSLYRFKNKQH